ncbi:OprO/OprP family phosphate-selective porin [Solimonas marina]|uniref:Porin n=1 Tax=Solimonas marina TaxID=2714601 RepID=A0A969W782_9GAMM|nr:porin [Solimonas marina]NKF21687.1 porin [Solimonas marina]
MKRAFATRGTRTLFAAASGIAGLAPFAAHADEVSPAALDQRLRIVEQKLAEPSPPSAATVSAGPRGFTIASGDYQLSLHALAQVDGRFYVDDTDARFNDGFRLRRLRPTFDGSLGKLIGFRLTPEFAGDGSGSSASVVDAYIDLRFSPAASVRVGRQKGPLGLERLQSSTSLSFVERGYPTELVPNRDIGVALFGELLDRRVSYTVGLFNGTRDGRDVDGVDADGRHELEGRIFIEPFRSTPGVLQGLGFGIGASTGTQKSSSAGSSTLPQYRSPGQNTFFQYVATAQPDGTHTRWSPQAYWYYGSVGALAEYARSKQDVRNTPSGGSATTESFGNDGYELTLTYVLTGEKASYKGVGQPRHAVGADGWGAWEVAARYGALDVDNDVFRDGYANASSAASKASSIGVGINWYLTANAKLVLDYDHTRYDGGASSGDRQAEKAVFTRLQISY